MMSTLDRLQKTASWQTLQSLLGVAKTEAQYEHQKSALRELMMRTPDSPENPFNSLMETLAISIETYEDTHYALSRPDPIAVITALMQEHGLKQSGLPEIGNQAKVSEILSGKRQLNTRQIRALSDRFKVSPAVLMGASRLA